MLKKFLKSEKSGSILEKSMVASAIIASFITAILFFIDHNKDIILKISEFIISNSLLFTSTISMVFIFSIYITRTFKNSVEKSQYTTDSFMSILENEDLNLRLKKIEKLILELNAKNSNPSEIEFSENDKSQLLEKIAEISSIDLAEIAQDKIAEGFNASRAIKLEDNALRRLSQQTVTLGKRAERNLLVALFAAFFGLITLGIVVATNHSEPISDSWLGLIQRYIPQITAILIIEVIAFYFLKLYANTLSELRYTQNEITNVEMRLVAFHHGISGRPKNTQANYSLKKLAETERNHILKKGQTTAEIESNKADGEQMAKAMSAAAQLLHGPGPTRSLRNKSGEQK